MEDKHAPQPPRANVRRKSLDRLLETSHAIKPKPNSRPFPGLPHLLSMFLQIQHALDLLRVEDEDAIHLLYSRVRRFGFSRASSHIKVTSKSPTVYFNSSQVSLSEVLRFAVLPLMIPFCSDRVLYLL